ncbi:MAG: H4MPT-linked C1 transfer pathway protein [Planctomycetota bacterium]|nr:H4MPT-linked C1 transfer pathway protein [Planctomycetota bacterium]
MKTLALDIGGANLKAAHSVGGAWRARNISFALWQHPGQLAQKLIDLACDAPPFERVLVTMTAELCDCFATKREGVKHVLHAVELTAGGRAIRVWTTRGKFVDVGEANADPLACAAANWHALASHVAKQHPRGHSLLIDMGSTTTDIIPMQDGRPTARGLTDLDRLATGELVYTGAWRTNLAALGPSVRWDGREVGVMAEYFATTADAHVLLGHLPEEPTRTDTADGRAMTREFAAARLARTIGADMEMLTAEGVAELAQVFATAQERQLVEAIGRVVGSHKPAHVVLAGSGESIAARAAAAAFPEGSGVRISRLATSIGPEASGAACAYAMLKLAESEP